MLKRHVVRIFSFLHSSNYSNWLLLVQRFFLADYDDVYDVDIDVVVVVVDVDDDDDDDGNFYSVFD